MNLFNLSDEELRRLHKAARLLETRRSPRRFTSVWDFAKEMGEMVLVGAIGIFSIAAIFGIFAAAVWLLSLLPHTST